MNRRRFIRNGALWVAAPFVLIPRKSLGYPLFDPAINLATPTGGASCGVQHDNNPTDLGGGPTISGVQYQSIQFTAGGTYTACAVQIRVTKSGTPNFNVDVSLWSDSGGTKPNAILGSASTPVSTTTFASGASNVIFPLGATVSIVSGTKYWIVVHDANPPFDSSLLFDISSFAGQQASSTDSVTWTNGTYGNVSATFAILAAS